MSTLFEEAKRLPVSQRIELVEAIWDSIADESPEEEALRREVDLVVLNRAGPDLIHRVLRDGELLVENDRSHRIRFEVDSRNAYFDLLPYLREYRRGRVA